MRNNYKDCEKALSLLLAGELSAGGNKDKINNFLLQNNIDWQKFKELLAYHELFGFVFHILKEVSGRIPADFLNILKTSYYYSLSSSQKIWAEFLRIYFLFEKSGVILLPLKGVSFLEDIYSENPVRPMVDIDCLVKEPDLNLAEGILSGLGYQKELGGLKEEYWRNKQYHLAFTNPSSRRSTIVELHWGLDYKRYGKNLFPELWSRCRQLDLGDRKIQVLSPEDAFFSLALHNRRFGKPLCLKNVYDFAMLINKYGNNFDWDYVLAQCRKYRLFCCAYFFLFQASFAFGTKIPGRILKELKVSRHKRALIERFVIKNTFCPAGKNLFLKSHFLLYDDFWEPAEYIINIPQEQFAKYYRLQPYARRTKLYYRWRFFYIPFKALAALLY